MEKLEKYLEYFKNIKDIKESGNRVVEYHENGSISIYAVLDEKLNSFISDFYDSNIFDKNYKDNMGVLGDTVNKIKSLTKEELSTLLTHHIRMDRFCEGHLMSVANDGQLYEILKKLINYKWNKRT